MCAVRARECVRCACVCVSEALQVGPMRACVRVPVCVCMYVPVCMGMCDAYVHAFVCVRVVFVCPVWCERGAARL